MKNMMNKENTYRGRQWGAYRQSASSREKAELFGPNGVASHGRRQTVSGLSSLNYDYLFIKNNKNKFITSIHLFSEEEDGEGMRLALLWVQRRRKEAKPRPSSDSHSIPSTPV